MYLLMVRYCIVICFLVFNSREKERENKRERERDDCGKGNYSTIQFKKEHWWGVLVIPKVGNNYHYC